MSESRFSRFQSWRKSRMNIWQLMAEAIVPSFCGDLDEMAEFDRTHDEDGYPLRTPEQEAAYKAYRENHSATA